MYRIVKRDGRIVDFDITKISGAIKKAFEATETPEGDGVVDFLALRVTADFARKVQNGLVSIEQIQDSVESVLSRAGYEDVAKAYILYRKQHERYNTYAKSYRKELNSQYQEMLKGARNGSGS